MKTYTISQQGLDKIRRRRIITFTLIGIPVVGFIAWQAWSVINQSPSGIGAVLPFAIFVFFLPVLVYRNLRQQLTVWKSVVVELGDDFISRQQLRIPAVRIRRDEITRTLALPTTLDGYGEIKATLSQWTPIESPSSDTTRRAIAKNWILIIAALSGVAVLFVATDWWLVIPVSVILVGYMIYSYITLRRMEGVDPNYRRRMAIGTVFIILIAILRACLEIQPAIRNRAYP